MRWRSLLIVMLLTINPLASASAVVTLVYHDVTADPGSDWYAVSRAQFVAQMDYLQQHGYTPISLARWQQVRAGNGKLPHKPVVLSFDDGLKSHHDFVAPILKLYGYPAVFAVVTGWLDGQGLPAEYHDALMDWKQVKQLHRQPLFEIVSHTHGLHQGLRSNPQGNEAAAAITRRYDAVAGRYENELQYRRRIHKDMHRSVLRLRQQLGLTPLAVVWPYGEYQQTLVDIAHGLGIPMHMTLEEGASELDELPKVRRYMLTRETTLNEFGAMLQQRRATPRQQRLAEFGLQAFAGLDAQAQHKVLSELLDRLQQFKIDTVIVSPFNHDYTRAYFPNSEIPVATDVLNRVLHQIRTRVPARHVYLKLPATAPKADSESLYTDLARLTHFNGVVFTGPGEAGAIVHAQQLFRRYRPVTRFGRMLPYADQGSYDFTVASLTVSDNTQALQSLLQTNSDARPRLLVSLSLENNDSAAGLTAVTQRLRSAGIEHYGIRLDDKLKLLQNRALLATALQRHQQPKEPKEPQ